MNFYFSPQSFKKKKKKLSFLIRKVFGILKKPLCVFSNASRKINNLEMKCPEIISPEVNYC